MKIHVRSGKYRFCFWIPSWVLTNESMARMTEGLARKYAKDAMAGIPPETVPRLSAALKKVKKTYGSLDLVEVESAEGDLVKITL